MHDFVWQRAPSSGLLRDRRGSGADPLQRRMREVVDDVRNGYVTVEGARQEYGVEVDAETLKATEVGVRFSAWVGRAMSAVRPSPSLVADNLGVDFDCQRSRRAHGNGQCALHRR